MRTFMNNHPFIALAMVGIICTTILAKEYIKTPDVKVMCIKDKTESEEKNTDTKSKE